MGNNFSLDRKVFTVYNLSREYEFDDRLNYAASNSLVFLGDAEGKVSTIRATVDFLYDIQTEVYKAKQIQERSTQKGMGQIFNSYAPDTNIYNEIYYKYKIEGVKVFRRLNNISSIDIEANPGLLFL